MSRPAMKWTVIGVVVIFILIQAIRPSRTNPPVVESRTLEAHVQVPPQVQTVLMRSCYNCHSNATVWPWYSNVAPVSWLVANDVNTARGHVNLQDWQAQVNEQEGKEHLGLICKLIREGTMPPAKYRIMHSDANISPEEANTVCAWSQQFASADDSDHDHDHHEHDHKEN
jgi:hypothetical protein